MRRTRNNPWLHRFALLTAGATFVLIWIGGLVTSKGAGMAVPDWPTTYGYNMFLFPISKWTGGIFYEHSHRLVASGVGLLTVILAVWLWLKEERRWLRNLGVIAVVGVVGQGILGGLRVAAMKDELGIFHATIAQLFLILICAIAMFTSRWWVEAARVDGTREPGRFHFWAMALAVLILGQLVVGATMRHQHAGLAIPDFPLAYGQLWPAADAEAVARYNQQRGEVAALNLITPAQIYLQMVHRMIAVFIVAGAMAVFWTVRRHFRASSGLVLLSRILFALVLVQGTLGAWTIWSNKAADIATAHVALGALTFVSSALLVIAGRRSLPVASAVGTADSAVSLGDLEKRAVKA